VPRSRMTYLRGVVPWHQPVQAAGKVAHKSSSQMQNRSLPFSVARLHALKRVSLLTAVHAPLLERGADRCFGRTPDWIVEFAKGNREKYSVHPSAARSTREKDRAPASPKRAHRLDTGERMSAFLIFNQAMRAKRLILIYINSYLQTGPCQRDSPGSAGEPFHPARTHSIWTIPAGSSHITPS